MGRIERVGRLIQEHGQCPLGDGGGDPDLLPLAPGEGIHGSVQEVADPAGLDRLGDGRPVSLRQRIQRMNMSVTPRLNHVLNAKAHVALVDLGHVGDLSGNLSAAHVAHRVAINADYPRLGRHEAQQTCHQCRFARPVWTDDRNALPVLDLHRDILQHDSSQPSNGQLLGLNGHKA